MRIVHHGARYRKPLHHAAGKSAHHLISTIRELEFFEQRCSPFIPLFCAESEVRAVEGENLAGCQREIQIRALRDNSDQTFNRRLLFPDLMLADPGFTAGGTHARGEHADGGGLSGAVRTEKSEDFSGLDR